MTEQKKEYQHTIAKEVSYSGIGLHSGKDVLMTLKPAEADTGIVFVRTDLPGRPEIKALPENVSSTVKATTLSANGAEVFTVEHLMGALSMMAIDNIRIEMSSPEPPVTDGSAKVFCELIEKQNRCSRRQSVIYMPLIKHFPFMTMTVISLFYLMTATEFLLHLSTVIRCWEPSISISCSIRRALKRILWLPEQLLLLPSWKCCVRWDWALAVR